MNTVCDQLNGSMVQFKEASPNFYNEYFAARVIVNQPGSRTVPAEINTTALPSPSTTATPVAQAA